MKNFINKFVKVSKDVIKFTARTIELIIAGAVIIAIIPIVIVAMPLMTIFDCVAEGGSLIDTLDNTIKEIFDKI